MAESNQVSRILAAAERYRKTHDDGDFDDMRTTIEAELNAARGLAEKEGRLETGNWIIMLSRLKDAGFDVNMTAEDLTALRSPALLAEFERIAEHLDERGY